MLKLCGFHVSNYHNKVRLALLEKGIATAVATDAHHIGDLQQAASGLASVVLPWTVPPSAGPVMS